MLSQFVPLPGIFTPHSMFFKLTISGNFNFKAKPEWRERARRMISENNLVIFSSRMSREPNCLTIIEEMFIAKGPLVRGCAIPDNLGDVAAASGQVRLFRSMTMMGGVQKIRFCILGENHGQSNGGRLPELERRSTVAGNATKHFHWRTE